MGTLIYAQSGGVTAVINASACGAILSARAAGWSILGARHGILGVLAEDLVDTDPLSLTELARLRALPGGAFGSCRYDLPPEETAPQLYDRLFAVFDAHQVRGLLYNGGNGSMDTVARLQAAADRRGHPLRVAGIPKTVDNDIVGTDYCPGYGSAAKYLATSMREVALDLRAMGEPYGRRRPRVFVLEVMGRNAGWLAAATAAARGEDEHMPDLILLPEIAFEPERVLERVRACAQARGVCAVVVAEGLCDAAGRPVSEHAHEGRYVQLGGAGQAVARLIEDRLGYKSHVAVADYLQRAARHLASAQDLAHAEALGAAAATYVCAGQGGLLPVLVREPGGWRIAPRAAHEIANLERRLPPEFIASDGLDVSPAFLEWLRPLLQGEAPPAFADGLPDYRLPAFARRSPRLPAFELFAA